MIILLSPSKNLHANPQAAHRFSHPRFAEEAQQLLVSLQKLRQQDLTDLMEISEALAKLNYNRYRSFTWPHTPDIATAAIYTFRGEVYQGFDAATMTKAQAEAADKRVRIISGLYGLLRPLDLIQPYRLEMGTQLKTGKYKNLYAFWGGKITDLLSAEINSTKSKCVINLASQEYSAAIQPEKLGVPLISVSFLEDRNGKLQFLSYNAKRSRGWMARYIVDKKIKSPGDLQGFDLEGYTFREELSSDDKMVFVR